MHELPVTQNILEIALRHAKAANASRIMSINIVIGELASIVDDSIQFYWDIISSDTIAEGAKLNFNRINAEFECKVCGERYNLQGNELVCPDCGSLQIDIIAGKEFFLESIDVE